MIKNVSSGVRLKHFNQIQDGIVSQLYLSTGCVIKDQPRSPFAILSYACFSEEFVDLPKRDVAPEDDDDDATDVLVIDRFDAALLFVGRFFIKALFFSRNKSSSSSVSGLALSSSSTSSRDLLGRSSKRKISGFLTSRVDFRILQLILSILTFCSQLNDQMLNSAISDKSSSLPKDYRSLPFSENVCSLWLLLPIPLPSMPFDFHSAREPKKTHFLNNLKLFLKKFEIRIFSLSIAMKQTTLATSLQTT